MSSGKLQRLGCRLSTRISSKPIKSSTKINFVSTNTRVNTTTVRDSHPINDTHSNQIDPHTSTYANGTAGRTANNIIPPTAPDINSTITSFLEDFKSLINPLISLLTKVIEKLLAK
ncbi:Nucleic-acid-binding protein [Aphis craccivora]|uniref:Nucleic-acid-binding protein n=1 Tax=Aphis craccivora TaxID=307492 RepID=A0A6G0VQ54_APHCR|nr:Nucleic-acid-binding protein [Aphis craccivora]